MHGVQEPDGAGFGVIGPGRPPALRAGVWGDVVEVSAFVVVEVERADEGSGEAPSAFRGHPH